MHGQALSHFVTMLTHSLRSNNKNADKSVLAKNDLKHEKLARQRPEQKLAANMMHRIQLKLISLLTAERYLLDIV
jgi:hypothetical protein